MTNELFNPRGERRTLLFYRQPDAPKTDTWAFWMGTWRRRLASGRDLVIVIDADRTEGATRIGKSTLGLTICAELDRSFAAATVRERVAGGASDLAKFVAACRPGQAFLYDEGMWGARSRDAMSPDAKMVGEVIGTLASRGAIVIFCCHSMLSLDTEVKALAAVRLLVRRRGLAEVHTPQIQLDLERPRLLPFREADVSPITWRRMRGPLWETYLEVKKDLQDARVKRELEAQRVWEARRLGQPARAASSEGVPAGGPDTGASARAPRWPCKNCGTEWGRRSDRDRHEARCATPIAATGAA